jgi:hypothetical protein
MPNRAASLAGPAAAGGRRGRPLLAGAAVLLGLGLLVTVGSPASAATATRYVLTAFTNSSESNLYVYTSPDARNFTLLRGPAYTPPSGLIRDPSVLRHSDGRYYVVYTTNWTGTEFGIASSVDLLTWTFVRNVPVSVPGIVNTWAPEWFVDPADGSVNVIVSLSTTSYANFRPYRFRALNTGFSAWAAPVVLGGIGPNYIDTFVVRAGSTYHAFVKNETTKYLEHAVATRLDGPYTFVGTGNWAGWGSGIEGPALSQQDDGTWRIYMDGYTAGHYYTATSTDLNTWSARTDVGGGLSGFIRHGTVLRETVTTPDPFASTAVAQHSQKCLTAPTGPAGTQLQQAACNGLAAQSFQFRPRPGTVDVFTVVNSATGLCLDVNGQSTADGATVIGWSCGAGTNQSFTLRPTGSGVYQLVAVHSGKCVDVSEASTADAARIIQWRCGTGTNQRWRLPGRP